MHQPRNVRSVLANEAPRVVDERFCEPDSGLCANAASDDWSEVRPYRGLNANMHPCEALLAAYRPTDERVFLNTAAAVAEHVSRDGTDGLNDLLWEHYTSSWKPDFDYNLDQPTLQFRPWGYLPGHHDEWAKLLLILHDHQPAESLVQRAKELFDTAVELGWDEEHGEFYYTTDDDPMSRDEHGRAHADAIGAASLLGRYGESNFEWYDRLWEYADAPFVNPRDGTCTNA